MAVPMFPLDRRRFLSAAGVSVALPLFESRLRPLAAAPAVQAAAEPKRRMVCVGNMLGFYPKAFWPDASSDAAFETSRTLSPLRPLRNDLTLISGLDHGVDGGHFSIHAFLSGVRAADAKSMPDGNITVDQRAAEALVGRTRFSSLTVGSQDGIHGGCQLSWTRSGVRVPPIPGPQQLFQKLFVSDDAQNKKKAADRLSLHGSILDAVREDAHSLQPELSQIDRHKLDEYFTSIRDVEQRLELRRQWLDIPKPKPPFAEPKNGDMVKDLPLLYDLIALAIQSDSTRVATLELGGDFEARTFGYSNGYHALSHHGQVQESIDALIEIETYQVAEFARFLGRLQELSDENGSLLDQTMVLFGSGMGDANSHTNRNLPVVLAGGGFRHTGHLAFDSKEPGRPPLTNLFVTMLQQMGIETDRFATSTGTLRGLA